jgi:CO/xanthine dehydrogenase FAD-binding subunit
MYPLLSLAAGRIADHTIQCKLTLGGNLAGTIHYHETLLPLLLANATIHIANAQGIRQVPICDILNMGRKLNAGELILMVNLEKRYTAYPFAHIKKTKSEKIGYPLVSIAALNMDGMLRLAVSALCSFPFRFNDSPMADTRPVMGIIKDFVTELPEPILNDLEGSPGYRQFIFEKTVEKIIMELRRSKAKDA